MIDEGVDTGHRSLRGSTAYPGGERTGAVVAGAAPVIRPGSSTMTGD